jgi:shikimate kinase/3-dehydroquinate synthase
MRDGTAARVMSLVGQMGAGKSTLASALASALLERGVPARAVDLDQVVAARAGLSVAALFARDGEAAFRVLEREALRAVLAEARASVEVVMLATGGGAPCTDEAASLLAAAGPVIWLDAPPEALARRAATADRPLLAGQGLPEAEATLAAQRASRVPFYARADVRLDATAPVPALVEAVLARYAWRLMGSIPPPLEVRLPAPDPGETGRSDYRVRFLPDLPGPAVADAVARLMPRASRLLVVTDANVARLHLEPLLAALRGSATLARVEAFIVEPGEASKTLATVAAITDAALAAGLSRADGLVAFGGGVVGDLAGFAASMLHRGVPFVQVPTTLLAQVDSAVGGKTGVNHALGKNLLGAFWQPVEVVASQAVLATLPQREVRCGLAEALKHGLIADRGLVLEMTRGREALLALEPAALASLIARCCAIKADVVTRDPRESGERALLNFGHTLGHAYELLAGYGVLTHGEAVALGMLHAARVSERLGRRASREVALFEPIRALLASFGFATELDDPRWPPLPALLQAARSDKKADARGTVRYIVLDAIGEARVVALTWDELAALTAPGEP